MSTFSSVVNKSGKKFAPKATARRNVPPRATPATTPTTEASQPSAQAEVTSSIASQDTAVTLAAPEPQNIRREDSTPLVQASHNATSTLVVTPIDPSPPNSNVIRKPTPSAEAPRAAGRIRRNAVRTSSTAKHGEQLSQDKATPAPWPSSKARPISEPAPGKRRKQVENKQVNTPSAGARNGDSVEAQGVQLEIVHPDTSVQLPVSKPTNRSHRGTRGGAKGKADARKADAQNKEATEVALGYMAATPASQTFSERRRKVVPHGPLPAPGTDVTRDIAALTDIASVEQVTPRVDNANALTEQTLRPPKRKQTKKPMTVVAAEIVAEATRETVDSDGGDDDTAEANKRRKRKRMSKEEAEAHEIAPAEVKMADLIKDKGLGKKSRLEGRMEEVDWDDVKRKRKEQEEEAEKRQELDKEQRRTGLADTQDDMPAAATVPKMTIRNGQIVMEEESRLVDRHAEINGEGGEEVEVQEVDDVTKRVNQSTIGRRSGVKQKGNGIVLQRSANVWHGFHDDQQDVSWIDETTCQAQVRSRRTC